jgi:tetratricopeptide (TPR) repeat protein
MSGFISNDPDASDPDGDPRPENDGDIEDFSPLNPRFIPDGGYLAQAANRALDEARAFLLLHRDEPQVISENLDRLFEVILAASQVKGGHQEKAIRLGLSLEYQYWLNRHKIDNWLKLIMALLKTSLELKNEKLQSEIYRTWGVCLYLLRDEAKSAKAFEVALAYAVDSGREDLKLLARAEHFNFQATRLTVDQAQAEALAILQEAARMDYVYVQGRAYFSLARAYRDKGVSGLAFAYAQQALVFFLRQEDYVLAGEATSTMLDSLGVHGYYSNEYWTRLFSFFESMMQKTVNPWFRTALYYHQAVNWYHNGLYDLARESVLCAWVNARIVRQTDSLARIKHMLGLIQMKHKKWNNAACHLRASCEIYAKSGEESLAIQARHGLAYIPYEQGRFRQALEELERVRCAALSIQDVTTREQLVQYIQEDIDAAHRQLKGSGQSD